jgi:hypothetical protein
MPQGGRMRGFKDSSETFFLKFQNPCILGPLNPCIRCNLKTFEQIVGKNKNDTPSTFPMDTISLLIQIPPHEIAYLNFVFESYEGVAAVRTVDPRKGIVELMVSPSYQEEIKEILEDLAEEFPIQEVVEKRK